MVIRRLKGEVLNLREEISFLKVETYFHQNKLLIIFISVIILFIYFCRAKAEKEIS